MKSIIYGKRGLILRSIGQLVLDMVLVYLALRLSVLMRYEGAVTRRIFSRIMRQVPLILTCYGLTSLASGVYSMIWKYASGRELFRLSATYAAAGGITLVLNRLLVWQISRPVLGMTAVFGLILVVSTRYSWRMAREKMRSDAPRKVRILIVGAGEGGAYAARICRQNRANLGTPVAFADDDPLKQHMRVSGIPICGTTSEIPEIVRLKRVDEIIVAIPGTHGERLTEIIGICKSTRCRTRILSDPNDISKSDPGTNPAFRELNTSDFLSRAEVALDVGSIRSYITGKVVLVTGGGGSIGSEICRQIMRFDPEKLLIFDIYENCAYELLCELQQKYGKDVPAEVLIGSIRDKARLDNVFEAYRPSVVFHAAAHKHVPLMEFSPGEAVKNNVFGTHNLLVSASIHGVERFVQLSTDKAVNPTNVMGATKRITEMLLQSFAKTTNMKCMAVRFGNVLGSHGSVIPLFESQIRKGGPVTLTHPDVTRYFMTIPEAAQLVLQAGSLAVPGAIYVLDMGEPVKIMDLAKKLIRFYGYKPGVDIKIEIIGLRPGEKLYEELLMDKESAQMTRTAHDKIFVAPPMDFSREDFDVHLNRLWEAAQSHEDQQVVDVLMDIVRTYRPNRDMITESQPKA